MMFIPGGEFAMGSDHHYAEEKPAHRVKVDGFWMDNAPVTNADFKRFVKDTGHITFAEIDPDPKDYPGALPHLLHAGSLVFVKSTGPVDLTNWSNWWNFTFEADWRHPYGPGSSIKGLDDHPVVHVAFHDAVAYARWAGKELPTEAEWEFAARGGLESKEFAWGDVFEPNGKPMANTWQGEFPWQNLLKDGYEGISTVGTYTPNGYGLYDMIGNVWEWTTDFYVASHKQQHSCCMPVNPRGPRAEDSYDPCQPHSKIPRKVIKGGSHLCAPNYCRRYRPAARHAEPIDTSTCHLGFRCIKREIGSDA